MCFEFKGLKCLKEKKKYFIYIVFTMTLVCGIVY